MTDVRRTQRALVQALRGGQETPIQTGRAYRVDLATQTATVRLGGGTAGVEYAIQTPELAQQLSSALAAGGTPSIRHANGVIVGLGGVSAPPEWNGSTSAIASPGNPKGAPSPHDLASSHHTGTLTNAQAPQFLLVDGTRALTGPLNLNPGVTIDGMDPSAHLLERNAHHPAFIGLTDDFGTPVDPVDERIGIISQSPHLLTSAATGMFSFNLNTSSNPGAASKLLTSTLSGGLQLIDLTLTGELNSPGDLTLDPAGNTVAVARPYAIDLGELTRKFDTIHAAELAIETLVAQQKIGTIGGHILVGPSNVLTADILPTDTTIHVKYNNLANGDTIYLEKNGQTEFMQITSDPSGSGPYTYSVLRYLNDQE